MGYCTISRAAVGEDPIEERGYPEAWLKRYFPSNPNGAEALFGYFAFPSRVD